MGKNNISAGRKLGLRSTVGHDNEITGAKQKISERSRANQRSRCESARSDDNALATAILTARRQSARLINGRVLTLRLAASLELGLNELRADIAGMRALSLILHYTHRDAPELEKNSKFGQVLVSSMHDIESNVD